MAKPRRHSVMRRSTKMFEVLIKHLQHLVDSSQGDHNNSTPFIKTITYSEMIAKDNPSLEDQKKPSDSRY